MSPIKSLKALEILDSRGRPTIFCKCTFENDISAGASVPSGASTGMAEAHELRDNNKNRFHGLGVTEAINNINTEISRKCAGRRFANQSEFDSFIINLDGTTQKKRLGANAILACSLAFARATAKNQHLPLYEYFASLIGKKPGHLPKPTINLFSGGVHAGQQVAIQDVLLVPAIAKTTMEALEMVYTIYYAAADLILEKYNMRTLRADEGGLAPPFSDTNTMFEDAVSAIKKAGYIPGKDVFLAIDVASSRFFQKGMYQIDNKNVSSQEMVDIITTWTNQYPLVSVEDGLAEEDWTYWPLLKQKIQDKALVLGDDLLCTNPDRIEKAINTNAANALLLKVNQIGSLTEASKAYQLAKDAVWQVTVSARSGETEDNWLADLAVGWGGNQIKIGSITQSERLAKYNRLLMIEAETKFPLNQWPG